MSTGTRRTQRTLAIERVAGQLVTLARPGARAIVVEAPQTPIYVQFAREGDEIVGESVGTVHLPKLMVYHYGDALAARLRDLGWTEPGGENDARGGNWTRRWAVDKWDANVVARTTVSTLTDAYGIDPRAIAAGPAIP
jgi:hypothetical protein